MIGFDPVSYTTAEETGRAEVTVRIIRGTLANSVAVLLNTASGTALSKTLTLSLTRALSHFSLPLFQVAMISLQYRVVS